MKKIWNAGWPIVFLIWAFFALWQVGYDSPDEHYPTLERASGFLFGAWDDSWEWRDGLRSHWPGLILASWLWPWTKVFGIQDRLWLDSIARLLYALGAVWIFFSIRTLCKSILPDLSSKEVRRIQFWTVLQFPLLIWGTRNGLDTFALPFMVAGLAVFFLNPKHTKNAALGGVLLGAAVSLRYTLGLPVLIALVIRQNQRRNKNIAAFFLLTVAIVVMVALLNLGDAWLYRHYTGVAHFPVWEFFRFNILKGSGDFHASPWWELWAYAAVLLAPFLGFLTWPKTFSKKLRPQNWAVIVILGSLIVFSFIRHKEMRMIFPLLVFGPLAIIPHLPRWWERSAMGVNATAILLAMFLYSEPHGAFVRSLAQTSQIATQRRVKTVAVYGVGGAAQMPRFFINPGLNFIRIRPGETLPKDIPHLLLLGRALPESLSSHCQQVFKFKFGMLQRIQERVHPSSAPEGVWECRP